MAQIVGLVLAACTAFAVAAQAAPQPERIRGTVTAVGGHQITVHPRQGPDVVLSLNDATKYVGVVKASLSDVAKGSYIGTATKESGGGPVALEVVVFPPAMRGAGDGHYPWDRLPDTTAASPGETASSMTNGSVEGASPAGGTPVESSMTNGNVDVAGDRSGAKQITVSYKGGQQTILVPPTAPIVALQPAERAALTQGVAVFVRATKDGDELTANLVAVGKAGVVPPM